jgi:hypothetical protein
MPNRVLPSERGPAFNQLRSLREPLPYPHKAERVDSLEHDAVSAKVSTTLRAAQAVATARSRRA